MAVGRVLNVTENVIYPINMLLWVHVVCKYFTSTCISIRFKLVLLRQAKS